MNKTKFNWTLYLIVFTIIITVVTQIYWNYTNYNQNRQRILNDFQISIDNTVEQYYSSISKENMVTLVKKKHPKNKRLKIDAKIKTKNISGLKSTRLDSIISSLKESKFLFKRKNIKVFKGQKSADSLRLIKGLKTIFISMQEDTIQQEKFDSILKNEFKNKNINTNYQFNLFKNDSLISKYPETKNFISYKKLNAKSTFIGREKKILLDIEDPKIDTLKRSSVGILISIFLAFSIVLSLIYLQRTINKQKQLAEIKNDLISNITHEFKTPITTISASLEAVTNFNIRNDNEKTDKYLDIAKQQTGKLSLMVEKILETAILTSDELVLKKEETNIYELLSKLQTYSFMDKNIQFDSINKNLIASVDKFHFENAISNLIDNAIKYGGDKVRINLTEKNNQIHIEISDNGKGIKKAHRDKIFDKFYRIPKGNTHNIKGFGIGLYYTKTIIEKHKGSITLLPKKETTFKITLEKNG